MTTDTIMFRLFDPSTTLRVRLSKKGAITLKYKPQPLKRGYNLSFKKEY